MGTTSLQDLKSKKFWVALVAEFVGTMLLVLVGCGSTGNNNPDGSSNVVLIALCFGFSVGTLVWAIANVSGGHINPAVTVGFLVTRKISIVRAVLYVIFQMLGALVGAALLKALNPVKRLGTPGPNVGIGEAFGIELFITFVLVFTVFASVDGLRTDTKGSAPLTIGLSIAMCHLWAVPVTGSGMNPARVFGPAVVANLMEPEHWLYWVGPIIGGAVAAWLYDFLFAVNATPAKFRGFFTRYYDDENYDAQGLKTRSSVLPMKQTA